MQDRHTIRAILDLWFGQLDEAGLSPPERNGLWFQASDATDAEIRRRFGETVEAALTGRLDHWKADDEGLMALVLLLDQFTRNIFRGSPRAFSGDDEALRLVRSAIADGRDLGLPAVHRVFLYLPLEHAEDLGAQNECVARMDDLLVSCDPSAREQAAEYRRYAIAHRDVIERFGRFPHRNRILGRDSTPDEQDHLDRHGGF